MDYSYFTSAPQPYQFFGVLPTPTTDNVAHLEEYSAPPAVSHSRLEFEPTFHDVQKSYDPAFAAFQQNFHYDPSTFLPQPHAIPAQSPPVLSRQDSMIVASDTPSDPRAFVSEQTIEDLGIARSSSEEKDTLTPQQNRRKAQNRAA